MGKSDVLKAVRVGCRGRMQAIVGEGPRWLREPDQVRDTS